MFAEHDFATHSFEDAKTNIYAIKFYELSKKRRKFSSLSRMFALKLICCDYKSEANVIKRVRKHFLGIPENFFFIRIVGNLTQNDFFH